jgi:hypothetical protein
VIAGYFNGRQKTEAELDSALEHVLAFSNAPERAQKYLQLIEE